MESMIIIYDETENRLTEYYQGRGRGRGRGKEGERQRKTIGSANFTDE